MDNIFFLTSNIALARRNIMDFKFNFIRLLFDAKESMVAQVYFPRGDPITKKTRFHFFDMWLSSDEEEIKLIKS